jgi:membrane-associated protein
MPLDEHGPRDSSPASPGPSHASLTDVLRGREIPVWLRRLSLGVVIGRYVIVLGVVPAIPLLLLQERITLLVLLRPTKEWLLVGGAFLRVQGAPSPLLLLAAYTPLMIIVVWFFFIAGRAYQSTLRAGSGPRWLRRMLPPDKLELAQRMLVRRGPLVAVLGRVAALPPTLLAAAAGVSDIRWRRYLAADLAGALVAFAGVVAAGYGLGEAYERGGPWLTAIGAAVLIVLVALITRWIRREAARAPSSEVSMAAETPPGPGAAVGRDGRDRPGSPGPGGSDEAGPA